MITRDEHPEHQDELALREQIGLARLVNQLGHFAHRLVHRQVLELGERHQPEEQAERADHQAAHQQRAPVDPPEVDDRQVGHHEVRLAAHVHRQPLSRLCLRRLCRLSPLDAGATTASNSRTAIRPANVRSITFISLLKNTCLRSPH